ncbi:MAG TPA: hypothetical protein PKY62_12645 [Actinotalea sp.]|jgi:hypothetical protein|nr:hypothetical protein [Actinotalea sp.]
MPTDRLGRDEFFAKLSGLDEAALRKALWTLYWRGPAAQRQRIEALVEPQGEAGRARSVPPTPPDATAVLAEVKAFAALARSGAYLGRSRQVSPKERTRWRLTFRRLVQTALAALPGEGDDAAGRAVATLVDLACETKGTDFFRSEDPVEAARFVVSDAVRALWVRTREIEGDAFTATATRQLLRWESEYGWTRGGFGWVAERELPLATVLAGMLDSPAVWARAGRDYLDALDGVGGGSSGGGGGGGGLNRSRRDRADALTTWHLMLIDHLLDTEEAALLDRLVEHPALAEHLPPAAARRRPRPPSGSVTEHAGGRRAWVIADGGSRTVLHPPDHGGLKHGVVVLGMLTTQPGAHHLLTDAGDVQRDAQTLLRSSCRHGASLATCPSLDRGVNRRWSSAVSPKVAMRRGQTGVSRSSRRCASTSSR